jgi:hypothetical protein
MGRGMSFVGKGKNPLAATVLFHKDTASITAVSMTQKFGRITGTARPDLNIRKVYCTDKAFQDYKTYLENQEAIYSQLKTHPELNMTEILKLVDSKVLGRKVDRKNLYKVNNEYKEGAEHSIKNENNNQEQQEPQEDKMKRLVESWSKPTNDTDVAKLFREMISRGGSMPSAEVKTLIKNQGAYSCLTNILQTENRCWNTVFLKYENNHFIKQEAQDYYNEIVKA